MKPLIWVPVESETIVNDGYYTIDTTQGALLRFEGLEPENTSFRTVSAFESEWDYCWHKTESLISVGYFEEGMYDDWPNETEVNKDVSEYVGREIWVAETGLCYVTCLKVKTNSTTKFLVAYLNDPE